LRQFFSKSQSQVSLEKSISRTPSLPVETSKRILCRDGSTQHWAQLETIKTTNFFSTTEIKNNNSKQYCNNKNINNNTRTIMLAAAYIMAVSRQTHDTVSKLP
jgi:hypothetical protein